MVIPNQMSNQPRQWEQQCSTGEVRAGESRHLREVTRGSSVVLSLGEDAQWLKIPRANGQIPGNSSTLPLNILP